MKSKTPLAIVLIVVIIVAVVWIVAGLGGKKTLRGTVDPDVKWFQVKCENPECEWSKGPQKLREGMYQPLKADAEGGRFECPICHKKTLVDAAGGASSAP